MNVGFRFLHDEHWAEIEMDEEPGAWAGGEASRIARRGGFAGDQASSAELAVTLAAYAHLAHARQPIGALVVFPEIGEPPSAMAEVLGAQVPEDFTREEIVTLLAPEPHQLVLPLSVTDLDTPSGVAVRIRARYGATPETADSDLGRGDRVVYEQLTYIWHVTQENAIVILSMFFEDFVEAARILPFADDLARVCDIIIGSEAEAEMMAAGEIRPGR